MLIQMLVHHPQMLGTILKHTPTWVWGLLAALIALGLAPARSRSASLAAHRAAAARHDGAVALGHGLGLRQLAAVRLGAAGLGDRRRR